MVVNAFLQSKWFNIVVNPVLAKKWSLITFSQVVFQTASQAFFNHRHFTTKVKFEIEMCLLVEHMRGPNGVTKVNATLFHHQV